MTDKPTSPVSLRKDGAGAAPAKPQPPRHVLLACGALVLAGIAGLIAALTLLGDKGKGDWLYKSAVTSNNKLKPKDRKTSAQLLHDVASTVNSLIVMSVVVVVVLGLLAGAVYRGRYWSRWAVTGVYLLASFTGTLIGIGSLLEIGASAPPASFKLPAFIAGVAAIAGVILCWMRPSMDYFALNRPAPAAGAPAGRPRRGLFAPRPATSPAPARPVQRKQEAATKPDRSRSKQRVNNAAVAKGAELARTRAKAASKSRRTEAS